MAAPLERRMTPRTPALLIVLALLAPAARAQSSLEVPQPNSYQSGIGVISGWHCVAKRIEIKIDDYPLLLAGSGTQRNDTLQTCGRSDTGFSLLFNWNILTTQCGGCTFHHIQAYGDGALFSDRAFNVTSTGVEFLTGKTAAYTVPNFPNLNGGTTLMWDEGKQSFTIFQVTTNTFSLEGTYYGALLTGPQNPGCGPVDPSRLVARLGTFATHYASGQMSFGATYSDGSICQMTSVPTEAFDTNNTDGFVTATFQTACPEYPSGLRLRVNGQRLVADSLDQCTTAHVTAVKR